MNENPNRKHEIFIEQMSRHGERIKAYQAAYPKAKVNSARVNAAYLLKNPNIREEIAARKENIRSLATQEAAQEVKETMVGEVLTFQKKRQILAQIVNGQYFLKKVIPVREVIETKLPGGGIERKIVTSMKAIDMPPDHNDVLKALELDCKMTGDFANEARDPGDGNQPLLPAQIKLPDNQFFTFINILNSNG